MTLTVALWLRDLFAYSVQLALVVAAGFLLASLFRLQAPRVRLAFAQGLLGLALLLPLLQPWKAVREEPARVVVETRTLETGAAVAFDVRGTVAALLVSGSLFRLAVLCRRLRRLRGYRRLSRSLDGSAAVADAWHRVGVWAPVHASPEIGVPAAFGALRPVVLVPEHFIDLDAAAQRAVLCHELVHIRRHDWLQMVAEELAGAVLWFHPALWCVIARIRIAREQVVDEEAVRLTGERRAYLETLVRLARVAAARPVAPAALFLTESHLKGRVDVLLKEVTMSKGRVRAGLAATVAGVALVGVAAARAFPLEAPAGTAAAVPQVADDDEAVAGGVPGKAAAKQASERKLVSKVSPSYPAEAKSKGIEGIVLLDVLITAAGDVNDVKVTRGPSELHESAVSAVRQWRYEAGPQDTRATLTINYRLSKKDEKPRP